MQISLNFPAIFIGEPRSEKQVLGFGVTNALRRMELGGGGKGLDDCGDIFLNAIQDSKVRRGHMVSNLSSVLIANSERRIRLIRNANECQSRAS